MRSWLRVLRPRSLRVRAVIVAVAVALLPIAILAALRPIEDGLRARIEHRVREAARELAQSTHADTDAAAVALRWRVRVRVLEGARVLVDEDRDTRGWWGALGELLLGDPHGPSPESLDAALAPIAERDEVRAPGGPVVCRTSADESVMMCSAGARSADGQLVYVTHSTRRAAGAMESARYQIVKLSLVVMPLAVLLGLYLGWRFSVLTRALEQRNRRNEEFVADLAHEMKNPIAAIRAASESLDASERGARLAKILGDGSARLDAMVTSLLELARAESRTGERVRVNVAELVRNLVDAHADHARITVTAEPAFARVDVRAIESALRNLVDNAASFGTQVRVAVRAVRARVEIVVEDDGPGIDAAHIGRVFDRFFTTRGERQGTGLGLALVKAIVEAHDGTVRVESPGQGARFTVLL